MLVALVIGFVLAFVGSMPVAGPIAVIMVGKGLEGQRRPGLYIAIGAAVCEAGYACLAFLGLTAAFGRFPLLVPISRVLGCVILIALGVYFLVRSPKARAADAPPSSKQPRYGHLALGFSITLFNPTLIITWTAAVTAAQSTGLLRVHAYDAFPFAGGVAVGIVTWFSVLLWLLQRFQKKLSNERLGSIIKGMGVLLVVCGLGFGLRTVLTWHGGFALTAPSPKAEPPPSPSPAHSP